MNFHLGTDVRNVEGDKLGELQGVVYDPVHRRVMALVVQSAGTEQHDLLVTVRAITTDDGDGETIYLGLSQDQFRNMKQLDSNARNIAPRPDAGNITSDLVDRPVDVPDVLPVGAATGIESIAYIPIVQEETNLRDGDVVIGRSTLIVGTDGDLGHLARLFVNPEMWSITTLVAESGWIFQHDVEVPFDLVASVDPEQIALTVSRQSLDEKSSPRS